MDTLTVEEHVTQVVTPVDHEPSKSDPHRRWPLWLAIVGVLCLASGTILFVLSGNDPAPPPAEVSAAEAADHVFEQFVTDEGLTRYADVDMLKDDAASICAAFDHGHEWSTVIGILLEGGFTSYDAGSFVGATVAAYCPEHTNRLP